MRIDTKHVILALLAGGAVACTTDSQGLPPIEELKPGLTMIDVSDPSWGVTAAYVKDDHVVYMQQRIGYLKPEAYRLETPDEPANEIDFRFLDQNGQTFFIQRGGDKYIEPSWGSDLNDVFVNPPDPLQRDADFVLAREAAAAFGAAAPKGFEPFKFHADVFAARPAPSQDPDMIQRAANIEASRPDGAYWGWNGGGSWWLEGDLYDKGTSCVFGWCPAKHSGVAMWAYQSSWGLAINACNHGSCPGWSGMSYQCYSTSGRWVDSPSLSGNTSTDTSIAGGCNTPYNWNSGGYDHLCNDDSAYELWQVKNGNSGYNWNYNTNGDGYTFVYTGAGTGGDGSWVNYACNCQNNNACNNDWSRPICP